MTHGSTSHAPKKFLSPSPYMFKPMITKSSVTMLIKSASKRLKKEVDANERYALSVLIEEMKDLKEKL